MQMIHVKFIIIQMSFEMKLKPLLIIIINPRREFLVM